MIRMLMLGRLGNNLFQYAFGRVLSQRHGVPLAMDASWFNHRTWPYVEPLRRFPGMQNGSARLTRPFSLGSRILKKLTHKHHWEYLGIPIIREAPQDHRYAPTLLDAPADCVVFGYFQTARYFLEIEPQLREELDTSRMGLETGHEKFAESLRRPGSVAVHVRRTDYINNRNLIALGTGYYHNAMDEMRAKLGDVRFHLFSDDPAWCLRHLSGADTEVFTSSDPFSPLLDLHLMSLAHHHIIANSSYSWWAAWLGKKPGQRVVMPDRWHRDSIHAPIMEKQVGWDREQLIEIPHDC